VAGAALTLAEASAVLDPPISERQLRQIVTALQWVPCDYRRTGRPGHPHPAYDAAEIMKLHSALIPFMRI
jgi:hypothetical protein